MSSLTLPGQDEELAAVYEPYVHQRFARNDTEWRTIVNRVRRRWLIARLKRAVRWGRSGTARSQAAVKTKYERGWANFDFDKLAPHGQRKRYPLHWNGDNHMGNAAGMRRVHLLMLKRLIESLKPRSVLEVGAGTGINLLALAAHFPNVKFAGLELSASGVASARAAAQSNSLLGPIAEFAPFDTPHIDALCDVRFHNGSAQALPFEDREFDLVYTRQALEQMESIRDTVLREVARVSGYHVVLFEAFRDWNSRGMRRNRTVANGYFAARLSDLENYGLEVVASTKDLPSKIYMQVGLVVARRAGG